MQYPVTPTLSLPVKAVIGTLVVVEVAGIEKAVTLGAVVSLAVLLTVTETAVDWVELPAASYALAVRLYTPLATEVVFQLKA